MEGHFDAWMPKHERIMRFPFFGPFLYKQHQRRRNGSLPILIFLHLPLYRSPTVWLDCGLPSSVTETARTTEGRGSEMVLLLLEKYV